MGCYYCGNLGYLPLGRQLLEMTKGRKLNTLWKIRGAENVFGVVVAFFFGVFFLFVCLVFCYKEQPKKHFQEAQTASRRRAGISLPWCLQLRRAVLAGEGADCQANLLLSLSRMRRNFTQTLSIPQMAHPLLEKSGLTFFFLLPCSG